MLAVMHLTGGKLQQLRYEMDYSSCKMQQGRFTQLCKYKAYAYNICVVLINCIVLNVWYCYN